MHAEVANYFQNSLLYSIQKFFALCFKMMYYFFPRSLPKYFKKILHSDWFIRVVSCGFTDSSIRVYQSRSIIIIYSPLKV